MRGPHHLRGSCQSCLRDLVYYPGTSYYPTDWALAHVSPSPDDKTLGSTRPRLTTVNIILTSITHSSSTFLTLSYGQHFHCRIRPSPTGRTAEQWEILRRESTLTELDPGALDRWRARHPPIWSPSWWMLGCPFWHGQRRRTAHGVPYSHSSTSGHCRQSIVIQPQPGAFPV